MLTAAEDESEGLVPETGLTPSTYYWLSQGVTIVAVLFISFRYVC